MRVLAIETSGRSGSIALLEGTDDGGRPAGETLLAGPERTAKVLAPAIRDLLTTVGWPPGSIELVAVVVGPGSFTGLRIGVTTAKALAYAVGAKVVAVNTLSVLAAQAPADSGPLWAVLDAQRQELFAARFTDFDAELPQTIDGTQILTNDDWLAQLRPGDRVTGPALGRLAKQLRAGVVAVEETLWQPTASVAGRVGWAMYRRGQQQDVWTLAPEYYRPSAAEEKAEAGRGGDKERGRQGDKETS
jgi:tRNA threonylcarbamoyladenosine biosynthesis protein TsaB